MPIGNSCAFWRQTFLDLSISLHFHTACLCYVDTCCCLPSGTLKDSWLLSLKQMTKMLMSHLPVLFKQQKRLSLDKWMFQYIYSFSRGDVLNMFVCFTSSMLLHMVWYVVASSYWLPNYLDLFLLIPLVR